MRKLWFAFTAVVGLSFTVVLEGACTLYDWAELPSPG